MSKPHHQILVCGNERPMDNPKGSCLPKGSMALFAEIKKRIAERGLRGQIAVNSTNCLKCCPFGPTVAIWPEGHYYGHMTPDRADALLDSIVQGRAIPQWQVEEVEIGQY
ncbi:MAG: (2Fe-2S) ferredoxin domain-containing protein [Cyanobacteria bacterium REEB65]|nr:(2Fe-2S) ferredoxin domain-containing protein [Cyanobacteria bacterium REEB65]